MMGPYLGKKSTAKICKLILQKGSTIDYCELLRTKDFCKKIFRMDPGKFYLVLKLKKENSFD